MNLSRSKIISLPRMSLLTLLTLQAIWLVDNTGALLQAYLCVAQLHLHGCPFLTGLCWQESAGFSRLYQSVSGAIVRATQRMRGKLRGFETNLQSAQGSDATARKAEIIMANLYRCTSCCACFD